MRPDSLVDPQARRRCPAALGGRRVCLFRPAGGMAAFFKVPLVEIVDEMPMTTTMKIRKVDLSTRAQQLADDR
ncbi:hypothetical protein GCM10009646_65290 [Streptomyces aureus]